MSQAPLATAEADARRKHAEVQDHDHGHEDHDHMLAGADLVRIGLVAGAVVASWFGLWTFLAGLLGLEEAVAGFEGSHSRRPWRAATRSSRRRSPTCSPGA
jgi:hypothetical protein